MKFTQEDAQECIRQECKDICDLLLTKNRSYGNSFASPLNIFSRGLPADSQLLVRIDDKLSRVALGTEEMNEDTVIDLIGYLVLWRVLKRLQDGLQKTPSAT
jgi:hypothetical protein